MCIDFYGHHSGGSSFVYVNDFCYYINCLYITGTGVSSEKEQVNKSPSTIQYTVYNTDSIPSRTSVTIRQSGQIGIRGRDTLRDRSACGCT